MPVLEKKCLRVPCPKCGAKRGVTCKLLGKISGKLEPFCHDERIALADKREKEKT
jgi:hypothetical protein